MSIDYTTADEVTQDLLVEIRELLRLILIELKELKDLQEE